jgi:hypothetical protein
MAVSRPWRSPVARTKAVARRRRCLFRRKSVTRAPGHEEGVEIFEDLVLAASAVEKHVGLDRERTSPAPASPGQGDTLPYGPTTLPIPWKHSSEKGRASTRALAAQLPATERRRL